MGLSLTRQAAWHSLHFVDFSRGERLSSSWITAILSHSSIKIGLIFVFCSSVNASSRDICLRVICATKVLASGRGAGLASVFSWLGDVVPTSSKPPAVASSANRRTYFKRLLFGSMVLVVVGSRERPSD